METVERDYSPQGVKFYYIYKALAHPEHNGYVAPFTLKERLMHVAEAKRKLGSRFGWLCDSIDNDLKHALGNAPNSEFLIGPDGTILEARSWSNPASLRRDLAKLLGEVESPTTVAELDLPAIKPAETVRKGVVPRLQLPGRMRPVQVQPVAAEEPFFVKLRAELAVEYANRGEGQLYLGFFLDPLYKVHWNNQARPLEFSIEVPDGVQLAKSGGKGPKVEVAADADPREFLVRVTGRSDEPLKLTVTYFACDDAETFCRAVTQQYRIVLRPDRDGGSRRIPGGRRARGER